MPFGLIIIGDEILSGKRQDKHFAKARELFQPRALELAWVRYLPDEPAVIEDELRRSFGSGHAVFSFGGIGATPDDHTRACAARALGRPLVLHPEAKRLIQARIVAANLGALDEAANLHRLKMGEFPEGSDIIPNPYNQIPGFSIQQHYFLPGFPEMAAPMMEWVLDHFYQQQGQRQYLRSLILREAMESNLTPLMEEIERRFVGVKIFSLPMLQHERWGRCLEFGVKGFALPQVEEAFDFLQQSLPALQMEVCAVLN